MDARLDRWTHLHAKQSTAAARSVGEQLLARYGEPHRHYHDGRHLSEVLDAIDLLAHHAGDVNAVRLAAWLHDAVYDPTAAAGANESASADLAVSLLPPLGHAATQVALVVRLVRLTASHDPADDDVDGQVLCDADLRVLAASPERYAQYAADVRAEYTHLPDALFAAGRAQVMGRLLAHPRLFATATGHERWEARARANIEAELARLRP